jgi:hypothetical protein
MLRVTVPPTAPGIHTLFCGILHIQVPATQLLSRMVQSSSAAVDVTFLALFDVTGRGVIE